MAAALRAQGRTVYVVAFMNKQATRNTEGRTLHAFLKLVRQREFVRPCTVIWDECFQPNMYMHSRMVHLRHLPDVQWIFCGDHLQSQLHGCWRGVFCRNNLWGSSLLPLDVVELHQNHRTDDPRLLAFWEETRAATLADLPRLKRKAIEQFQAPMIPN